MGVFGTEQDWPWYAVSGLLGTIGLAILLCVLPDRLGYGMVFVFSDLSCFLCVVIPLALRSLCNKYMLFSHSCQSDRNWGNRLTDTIVIVFLSGHW